MEELHLLVLLMHGMNIKNPVFTEIPAAAENGDGSTVNIGRIKTNFEKFEEVENYMLSKK